MSAPLFSILDPLPKFSNQSNTACVTFACSLHWNINSLCDKDTSDTSSSDRTGFTMTGDNFDNRTPSTMIGGRLVVDEGGTLTDIGGSLTESSSRIVSNYFVAQVFSTIFKKLFVTLYFSAFLLYLICLSIRNMAYEIASTVLLDSLPFHQSYHICFTTYVRRYIYLV